MQCSTRLVLGWDQHWDWCSDTVATCWAPGFSCPQLTPSGKSHAAVLLYVVPKFLSWVKNQTTDAPTQTDGSGPEALAPEGAGEQGSLAAGEEPGCGATASPHSGARGAEAGRPSGVPRT